MTESCRECKFAFERNDGGNCECRRFPPQVDSRDWPMAAYPVVLHTNWCGEWKPKNDSIRLSLRIASYAEPTLPGKRCETCGAFRASRSSAAHGYCDLVDETGQIDGTVVKANGVCDAWERKAVKS